jgi:chromosome segregation ATPase
MKIRYKGFKERCICLEEKNHIVFDDGYLNQLAASSEYSTNDIRNYLNHLDDITKVLSRKLSDLELENRNQRENLQEKDNEINELMKELLEERKKNESISKECTSLQDRLKEMEEKYQKELKKSNLLEVENNRNLDEIKSLRRERNDLRSRVDKDKLTLKEKINRFIGR